MKYLSADFIEQRVLPVVLAFGLGVIVTLDVRNARMAELSDIADGAVAVAEHAINVAAQYREACAAPGEAVPVVALAVTGEQP